MVMYAIGKEYHQGTEIDIYGPLTDCEMDLAVTDADTGNGYDAELTVLQLSNGSWDVREAILGQLVGRKFDSWVYDEERQIPVEGTGLEALASALAQEYGANQAVILRALQAHPGPDA